MAGRAESACAGPAASRKIAVCGWANCGRRIATERLPPAVSEYYNQGAADGISAAVATAAWDRVRFRPRILRDVSSVSTATTVLGSELSTPVGVAPTAMHRGAHPMGELATARGALAAGALMEVSTNCGVTFEQIGATGRPVLWALTAGGESGEGGADGVIGLLSELTDEVREVMILAGARSVREITSDLLG
jgi:isopentenyl diphosphate isomerase/L-lactate dehydrogenase-like FMN-dependent dehydrogenase